MARTWKWLGRFTGVVYIGFLATLLPVACNDPVPLGPDLVTCECECVTKTVAGVHAGSDGCGNQCDPPCSSGTSCSIQGGCYGSCLPTSPPDYQVIQRTDTSLHVCVDSSDASLATRACQARCDHYASGSIFQCVNALLVAIGLERPGGDTIPFDIPDKINPNSARSLADIIVEECGTWLFDTVTGTCGLEQDGVNGLVDLFLCVASGIVAEIRGKPPVPEAVRTCNLIPNSRGELFGVQEKNGCPEYVKHDADADAGADDGVPVGGSPLAASANVISASSLVSISGSDVSGAAANPSGSASAGRVGPILIISMLSGTLPDGHLEVKGSDVTLTGGRFLLKDPVAAALTTGAAYAIPAGKLHFIVTGLVAGKRTSVEGTNAAEVTGHYDEATGTFDFAGGIDLPGLDAKVDMKLVFGFTNRPPRANAGPDRTVECSLPTREGVVELSAAASADPDPGDSIASYTWTIGPQLIAQGPDAKPVTARVGLGNRLATLTTVDTHGSVSRDTALINVVDTTPPVFDSVTVQPSCLWPPDHEMVLLRLGREIVAKATDACDASPIVYIKSVTSSQPDAGAKGAPDIVHGTGAVCLRAERAGSDKSPRVYTITLASVDFQGHEAEKKVDVIVPHDRGHTPCPEVDRSLVVPDGDPACVASAPGAPAAPIAAPSLTAGAPAGSSRDPRIIGAAVIAIAALAAIALRRARRP